jgi:hypothetical protein
MSFASGAAAFEQERASVKYGFTRQKAITVIAVILCLWYLYSAYLADQPRYGFHHLRNIPPSAALGLFLACFLATVLFRLKTGESEEAVPLPYRRLILPAICLSLLSAVAFWFLRSGFINDDGLFNMVSLQAGMRIIHHDEMLSSLMITRLWQSGITGFRPEDAFSLFSVIWGAFHVFTIMLLAGRTVGRRWPLFLAGCLSAGYIQLFVGDVEFYAMVASLVGLYLLLCLEHTRGHISLVLPCMALALAMSSHLLAGWLLPSLLVLFIRSLRAGRRAETAFSAAAFVLTTGFFFVIVSAAGLPVHAITQSHAMGSADRNTLDMLASPSLTYHSGVMNVLFLVFPFWLGLPLVLQKGWLKEQPFNQVLAVSTSMLLLLAVVWNLGLGPYHDWNLVATVGVPASILFWSNALKVRLIPSMKTSLFLLMLVAAIHSWTWIVGNHYAFSMMDRQWLNEIHFPTGKPVQMIFVLENQ